MIVFAKVLPLGFLAIGIFLLMQIVLPVASFQFWLIRQEYSNKLMVSPSLNQTGQILGVSVQNQQRFPAFVSEIRREIPAGFDGFSLTVPKLNINKMVVYVDSNDLSKGLVHLPGSALPGEKGNVFISGHSALSKFSSLKNAPFANLTNLKKGDEITLEALSVKFKYIVDDIKVVSPSDLSVISSPDPQGRYISLMTCVPPGLNYKRLVVLGKMI